MKDMKKSHFFGRPLEMRAGQDSETRREGMKKV
jgi:hypothetical protein